jgi:DNA-binding CsgD family transcriptional regulator
VDLELGVTNDSPNRRSLDARDGASVAAVDQEDEMAKVDQRIYERCERAAAALRGKPIMVLRGEGPLGEWTLAQLRATDADVLDVRFGSHAIPKLDSRVCCWVTEGDDIADVGAGPATVAVAPYGYRAPQRERLSKSVGGRVLWAPAGRVEILELVASVRGGIGAVDAIDEARLARGTESLQQALDLARRRLHLTPREAEVLRGIAVGLTNKQMMAQLPIGSAMVKKAIGSLFAKLGIRSRREVRWILAGGSGVAGVELR